MRLRSSSAPIERRRENQAGVVDGHAEGLDEAVEQLDVPRRRSGRGSSDSTAIRPISAPRARSAAYRPRPRCGARPGPPWRRGRPRITAPVLDVALHERRRAAARRRASPAHGCPCDAPGPTCRRPPRGGSTVTASNTIRSRSRAMVESSTSSRSSEAGSVWATRWSENEQRVGFGQPTEPVEGERLLAGRLERHLADEAADECDDQERRGPQHGRLEPVDRLVGADQPHARHDHGRCAGLLDGVGGALAEAGRAASGARAPTPTASPTRPTSGRWRWRWRRRERPSRGLTSPRPAPAAASATR